MPIIAEPWRRTPWVFLSCPNFCFSRDPHNWFDFLTLEKKLEGKDGFCLMKEKLNLQKWDRCSQQNPWEIPSLESTSTKPRMEHRGITQVAAHLCVGPLSNYPLLHSACTALWLWTQAINSQTGLWRENQIFVGREGEQNTSPRAPHF
jgi:hypothetical protein